MKRPPRRAIEIPLACVLLLTVTACSSQASKLPPRPTHDITAARGFRAFPIYYAGPSVGGLPLTGDGSFEVRTHRPGRPVALIYGQCTIPPQAEEQDCAPPIELFNNPTCTENPALYGPDSPHPVRRLRVRGVPAAIFNDAGHFDKLQLYSHLTTITIRAYTLRMAQLVARRLRGINRRLPASTKLPPPTPRELAGRAPCR